MSIKVEAGKASTSQEITPYKQHTPITEIKLLQWNTSTLKKETYEVIRDN